MSSCPRCSGDPVLGRASSDSTPGRTSRRPLTPQRRANEIRDFLRIASVLTLIHAILHTVGGVFGKPMPGPGEQAVAAMKANHFILMRNPRTYWGFYMGLGLGITIFLTTESIVFWLLASLAPTAGVRLRPIIAVFALGYLAFPVKSFRFFFLGPVVAEVLIVSCLILAILAAKERIPEGASPGFRDA